MSANLKTVVVALGKAHVWVRHTFTEGFEGNLDHPGEPDSADIHAVLISGSWVERCNFSKEWLASAEWQIVNDIKHDAAECKADRLIEQRAERAAA